MRAWVRAADSSMRSLGTPDSMAFAMPPRPSTEEVLTIDPPPAAFIGSTAARMPRKQPNWLIRITRS